MGFAAGALAFSFADHFIKKKAEEKHEKFDKKSAV